MQNGKNPPAVFDRGRFRQMKNVQYELIPLSSVEAVETDFLWYPYIPIGKITIMLADPGVGKTTLCLKGAAIVSTGGLFYGEEENPFEPKRPGFVIYQTAEDGLADTIVPRLQKMGADLNNICVINEKEQALTFTDGRIEQALKDKHPKLMIFDPIQAYLGAELDMHRANEVRPVLTELSRLAEEYRCAMVLVAHMSKMSSNSALYRALGSIDIVALARSELILVNKPNDPERHKILAHEKSSLAAHGNSIEFHIDYDAGGIVFDGYSDLKADDILGQRKETKRSSVALDEAKEFLEEMLAEGYADFQDIMKEAESRGIKRTVIYEAKKGLQLCHSTTGFGKDKKSIWYYKGYTVPKNNILLADN